MHKRFKTFNKTILLIFNNSGIATANINIPFPIDEVKFREIAYTPLTQNANHGYIDSDLINWNSLGIVFRDDALGGLVSTQNVRYIYPITTSVNGQYSFALKDLNGFLATNGSGDQCCIICEFIQYN